MMSLIRQSYPACFCIRATELAQKFAFLTTCKGVLSDQVWTCLENTLDRIHTCTQHCPGCVQMSGVNTILRDDCENTSTTYRLNQNNKPTMHKSPLNDLRVIYEVHWVWSCVKEGEKMYSALTAAHGVVWLKNKISKGTVVIGIIEELANHLQKSCKVYGMLVKLVQQHNSLSFLFIGFNRPLNSLYVVTHIKCTSIITL